jgi:hypothetical protein
MGIVANPRPLGVPDVAVSAEALARRQPEASISALHPEPTSARAPSVMCGRPRRSKGDLGCAPRSGAVMCPAYVARPLGPLALMQSAAWLPNRFTRWKWRITLDGSSKLRARPVRHHATIALLTLQLWQPLMGSFGFRLRHLGLLPACDRLLHARAKPIRSASFCQAIQISKFLLVRE